MALGITTAEVVRPATISALSQGRWYSRDQATAGTRELIASTSRFEETAPVGQLHRSAEHPSARERSPARTVADGIHPHSAARLAGHGEGSQEDPEDEGGRSRRGH